jgi:hypothetical protein
MHPNEQRALVEHKKLLARVSAADLMQKVRDFRRLDLRNMSDEKLGEEILNVIAVTAPDGSQRAFLKIHGRQFPAGSMFFRARGAGDDTVPPPNGLKRRDAEAPDASWVRKPGRLHKVGEPLLYTAIHDPHITLSECRIPLDGHAVVFAFTARRTIKAPVIGVTETGMEFSEDERLKLNIVNDFLHDEFAREVEARLEHLYRPSELIAKWYFDHPPSMQDCWVYTSTKNRKAMNAAFRPNKAHECLDLIGSMFVQKVAEDGMRVLSVGKPEGKKLRYYPVGSPEQMALFPQIKA